MPAKSRVESRQLATINALTVAPEFTARRKSVSPGCTRYATQSCGTTPQEALTGTGVALGFFSAVTVGDTGTLVDVDVGSETVGGIAVKVGVTPSSVTAATCVGRGGGRRV